MRSMFLGGLALGLTIAGLIELGGGVWLLLRARRRAEGREVEAAKVEAARSAIAAAIATAAIEVGTTDAVHELAVSEEQRGAGHTHVVVDCALCNIQGRCCYGPSHPARTREVARAHIAARMRAPIRGAVHVIPEREAYEVDVTRRLPPNAN